MTPPPNANQDKNRRRSQRVMLRLPIIVSGESPQGHFREETHTIVVNAHGALITLGARVSQQQTLRLKSHSSGEEQTCRITYVGPVAEGRTQLGIEFTHPAPQFWHIAFPPEDWSAAVDPVHPAAKS